MGRIGYIIALFMTGSSFANGVNSQFLMEENLYKNYARSSENQTTAPSENWLVGIFLIGRTVELPSNISTLFEKEGLLGSVYLKYEASEIIISISGISDNSVIRQLNLGARTVGYVDFRWDGLNYNGSPISAGLYKISAIANINGKQISIPTFGSFKIKSISHDDNSNIICQIDEYGQVKAKDIIRVF